MLKPPSPRMRKISDLIRKELARLIIKELDDPRISRVTIGDVHVAPDFASARIYVSALDQESLNQSVASLNHASSRLRTLLAKDLQLRKTPKLIFIADTSVLTGDHLIDLIDKSMKNLEE